MVRAAHKQCAGAESRESERHATDHLKDQMIEERRQRIRDTIMNIKTRKDKILEEAEKYLMDNHNDQKTAHLIQALVHIARETQQQNRSSSTEGQCVDSSFQGRCSLTSPHNTSVVRVFDPSHYKVGWMCANGTGYVAALAFLDERHEGPEHMTPDEKKNYTLGRVGMTNVIVA